MKITKILVPLLFVFCVQDVLSQKRGPSTEDERQKLVQYTHMLETDPLSGQATDARRWLIFFLAEVPDISITICASPLEPLLKSKKNYSAEIMAQMMFGQAAFIIEHTDKAKDNDAIYTAGVESSLKTYQSILKTKPKAAWPFLDEMIAKQQTSGWPEYVQGLVGKCGEK